MPNLDETKKSALDLRKRTHFMLKTQANIEGVNMVDIVEKAIEQYCKESASQILANQIYGEWTERERKVPGRKTKQEEVKEPVVEEKQEEVKEPVVEEKQEEVKEPVVEEKQEEVKEPVVEEKQEEVKEPVIEKEEVVEDDVLSCYM